MHQCGMQEIKFSTLCKKSRQERREEVCCSVCRILFCCPKNRENHEDDKHGRKAAETARQQRQLLKENKPLVCLGCCKVFISGLFVNNELCENVSHLKVKGSTHFLIIIPDWAVEKYLVASGKKRSWDVANEDVPEVGIVIHHTVDRTIEDSVPAQHSVSLKTSIHSILAKQRKTDLDEKRKRRVTFSPVTAVAAFTSKSSIIQVGSQKTRGGSSPDSAGTFPVRNPLIRTLRLEDSTPRESKPRTPLSGTGTPLSGTGTPVSDSPAVVPNVAAAAADAFFSPPLPSEGANGSPMMTPQMSSTPNADNSERRNLSEKETPEASAAEASAAEASAAEEAAVPNEGIFSSLANVICCAFQALPSVLTHFFSTINGTEPTDENRPSSGSGSGSGSRSYRRHRRQRRRSSTFTPYAPQSDKRRRLNQRNGHPLSPLPIVKFLRSPRRPS